MFLKFHTGNCLFIRWRNFFFFFIFSRKVRAKSEFLVLGVEIAEQCDVIKEGVNRMFLKKLKTARPKTIEGNN